MLRERLVYGNYFATALPSILYTSWIKPGKRIACFDDIVRNYTAKTHFLLLPGGPCHRFLRPKLPRNELLMILLETGCVC